MALAAGLLRHRIRIEQYVSERDSDGILQEGWQEVATVWAAIEPLSVREFIQSGQVQGQVTARITIRYRDGLSHTMRLVHRGTIYNIQGVLPDKVSGIEYVTLPVSQGVNEGQ